MEKSICKVCLKKVARIRAENHPHSTAFVYRDERGNRWHGRVCNDCDSTRVKRIHWRAGRSKSRFLGTDPRHIKAFKAEIEVANHFKNMGYQVSVSDQLGPDVTAKKNGVRLRIEVKCATLDNSCRSWHVARVMPARKKDHLIAIHFGPEKFVFQKMSDHLRLCLKGGTRCVSDIAYTFSL